MIARQHLRLHDRPRALIHSVFGQINLVGGAALVRPIFASGSCGFCHCSLLIFLPARLRSKVRAGFDASPYRDEVGFTRNLESKFREIFGVWLASGHG